MRPVRTERVSSLLRLLAGVALGVGVLVGCENPFASGGGPARITIYSPDPAVELDSDSVVVQAMAEDPRGVVSVTIRVNEGVEREVPVTPGKAVAFQMAVRALPIGTNRIELRVTSASGVRTSETLLIEAVDRTPPMVEILTPTSDDLADRTALLVRGTASDLRGVSRLSYVLDDGIEVDLPIEPGPHIAFEFLVPSVPPDNRILVVRARDGAGNIGEAWAGNPPGISVARQMLDLRMSLGRSGPLTDSLRVWSTRAGEITGLAVEIVYPPQVPTGWLSGRIGASTPARLTIEVHGEYLPVGSHEATVRIRGADVDVVEIPIRLVVQSGISRWDVESEAPAGPTLRGVWAASSGFAIAVGDAGTALHFDGSGWVQRETGTTEHLYGVWGASERNVYAVGAEGTILHFDGSRWRPMSSGTSNGLFAVHGAGPDEVYVVGNQSTVLHFDGQRWRTLRSGSGGTHQDNPSFWGVALRPGGEVIAVGTFADFFTSTGSAYMMISRFDGTAWTDTPRGRAPVSSFWGPLGIWSGQAGNELFVSDFPMRVLRFDGANWSGEASGEQIRSLAGTSGRSVYGVGDAIHHFDGSTWSVARPPSRYTLWAVTTTDDREVIAVGSGRTIVRGRPE